MQSKKNVTLEDSLKSADTEETLDIWFYRPLGFRLALLCERLHITPNMITIFSIFVGVAAGLLFYPANLKVNIIGMVLLVFANLLDSTDGQLARLTNNHTRLGRILDGLAGDLWFICIYLVCVFRLLNEGWSSWVWLLASAAGLCHILHAAMADYYRNIHLMILKSSSGSFCFKGNSPPCGSTVRGTFPCGCCVRKRRCPSLAISPNLTRNRAFSNFPLCGRTYWRNWYGAYLSDKQAWWN